jgi:hypothetical protein
MNIHFIHKPVDSFSSIPKIRSGQNTTERKNAGYHPYMPEKKKPFPNAINMP